MPYRVKINLKTWDEHHEAYFQNLPTREIVLRSVEVDRDKADEAYDRFYDEVQELVENFNWPTRWEAKMSAIGCAAYRSNKIMIPSNASGYIRIHRFDFTE